MVEGEWWKEVSWGGAEERWGNTKELRRDEEKGEKVAGRGPKKTTV